MDNLKITISAEYEDKYGGHANFSEEVSGDIFDMIGTIDKTDEAVGRLEKHLKEFRDAEPLPDDDGNIATESEASMTAHN